MVPSSRADRGMNRRAYLLGMFPHRQILVIALSMSASVGFGFSFNRAETAMIIPL
jgi:hypothetical protein